MPQPLLRIDTANDQMWMFVRLRNEETCNFDARMSDLNGLLRMGQVPTNESVDIRNRFLRLYLRETSFCHFISFHLLNGVSANNSIITACRQNGTNRNVLAILCNHHAEC